MSKEIRKFFESAEEMHKAFTGGKKVYRGTYESEIKPKYYQIKDGIICSFDAFNDKMLGIAHGSFTDCKSYFTFEKPVLKMQVGKKYKTRNNQIVFCFYSSTRRKKKEYDVVISNRALGEGAVYTVNENGSYWNEKDVEYDLDIVEEVED